MSEYSYEPGDNVKRTEMESGAARTRQRFIDVPTEFNVKWIFSREELGIFERFFKKDIYDGAGWFTMKLVNGTGEFDCSARFVGKYKSNTRANEHVWEVAAVLEVVGTPTLA